MAIEINDIKTLIDTGAKEKKDIWKDLLQILSNENSEDELGHYFFRKGDFEANSLVGKIQDKADLKISDDDFAKLLSNLSSKPFWNESMSSALSYFLKHFKINNKTESIPGIAAVTYEDVYNADAGATFDPLTKFVIPWKNIDDKDYKTVRSGDEIKAVIASDDNLQFTHKGDKNWIRLIMPEYERFVEIEDLDRNFWVIGQVISAISAYLFDDNGPMKNLLSNIMQELVELWENILYLWVALALYDNRKYTDVHVEAAYVPNDELQSQFKYDNFSGTPSWSDICNRFAHKIQDYPESNLIIIPIRRKGNYEHNYYRTERYPGILFYDRNNPLDNDLTKGFRILAFQKEVSGKRVDTGDVKVEDFEDSIYAAKNNENGTLDVVFSYADAKIKTEFVPSLYYGAIRTIIDFPPTSWSYDVDQGFTFKKLTLYHYDAIAEAISGEQVKVGKRTLERNIVINTATPAKTGDGDDQRILAELTFNSETGIRGETADGVKIKKGYYLGELASDGVLTKETSYSINENSVSMPPISSNRPENSATDTPKNKVYYSDILTVEDEIQNENLKILDLYRNKVLDENSKQIRLFVGTRAFDLDKKGEDDINWTSTDKAQNLIEAASVGGYYYARKGANDLYTREDLRKITFSSGSHRTFFNPSLDIPDAYPSDLKNAAKENLNLNTTYENNPYRIPFCIYSQINIASNIDDNTFTPKRWSSNVYSATSSSKVDLAAMYDNTTTLYTGTHGGRFDSGAFLTIPGLSTPIYYNDYSNIKVLPKLIKSGIDTGDGAYGIWLKGETKKLTRHTWNDTTTMILHDSSSSKITYNNWCILYIKSFGVYGAIGNFGAAVSDADTLDYYSLSGYEASKQTALHPKVFKIYAHIFLPNGGHFWGVYDKYPIQTTTQGRYDIATVDSNPSWITTNGFSNYSDLFALAVGDSTSNYTKTSWVSRYTSYEKNSDNTYTRSTKKDLLYNFYNHPYKGK